MSPLILLAIYCALILAASLAGGWIPQRVRLTHQRMELLVSFVSGVMLGVGLLHLLPHAWMQQVASIAGDAAARPRGHDLVDPILLWLLGGFLAMFLIERFFCYHHHEAPAEAAAAPAETAPAARSRHTLTWTGAAVGLGMHSLIEGVALAASVASLSAAEPVAGLAGAGVFLAIFLHKPFDALTLGTLAARSRASGRTQALLNGAFGLAVPAGAGLFLLAAGDGSGSGPGPGLLAAALAFSAGTFLCISLSDLLPELQFHSHDRVKLTAALLLGLAVAAAASRLEAHGHDHDEAAPVAQSLTGSDRKQTVP